MTVPPALRRPAVLTAADDWEPWIGYIRVSTWREEAISPDIQRNAIRAWAARTRRRILEPMIEDLDMTGRNFKRKIMQGIEAVERREARGIAVMRFNRFGRTDVGIRINLARLEEAGGQLASATEEIDVATAVGRFNRRVLLDLAAFESDRIGEDWQSTHAVRLANGVPSAGRPRFGYFWTPRRVPDVASPTGWRVQQESYEPLYPQGDALAEAYERYVTGEGFVTLTHMLNDLGYQTTRGRPWRHDTLLRYMDSGFASGLLRVRDFCDCGKGGRKHKSCAHWRAFPGAHDPLITPEVWQSYLERRGLVRRTPPRSRNPVYDITSLPRCSICKGSMKATPKPGAVYWRCALRDVGGNCTGAVGTGADLDLHVLVALLDIADGIDRAAPSPVRPLTQPDPAVARARLTEDHDRAQAALTRLVMDYARHPERYPAAAYDAARAELEAEQRAAAAELEKLPAAEAPRPTLADFQPLVRGLLAEWETLDTTGKNMVLRKVIREIRVYPRKGRHDTQARVVPVWEHPDATDPGPVNLSATLDAMPDGIAHKVAERFRRSHGQDG